MWTRYAAAVLVLVLIGWLSFKGLTSEDMIKVYADSKIRKIELADGTKVWLNKGSVFEYPKTFTKNNRKVRLDGEAYFQVARQTGKHKFTVESKLMTVVVHGTIFNMKSYARDTVAETSLIEGEVLVESANDDSKIVLLPGQKAIVEKNNHKMVVKETNSIMDGIWRNNMVPFQNATIQDIAKVLEDLYHVKIEVRKDIDLEHTYSGMIEKKQELEDVIKTLQNSIPIKYKIESDKVLIEPVE
jgi:ferric-dicitrate binding protein FerR (iron transport regulator)